MTVVSVISMKGGVGKTSATANIAAALARQLGAGVVGVVDLDPQNSLHLHYGQSNSVTAGLSSQSVQGRDWREALYVSEYGVECMPYGDVSEFDREAFEDLLEAQPDFVAKQMLGAGLSEKRIVLIDTPPGPSVYLRQASHCADIAIVVLLADGGSYATIPAMESWLAEVVAKQPDFKSLYLFNQVDGMNALGLDVIEVVRNHLGSRVIKSVIHSDEAVAEALAFQQPVSGYAPHSQSTRDFENIAKQLLEYVAQ